MRLTIVAVGRLKASPELSLLEDYRQRAGATGRALALGGPEVVEIDERKARDQAAQSEKLRAAIPDGARVMALDERGKTYTSPKFAEMLARERDSGCADLVFLIGGADGLDTSARERADMLLSLGSMVWPHMLVRVMLAEQIYRATAILAGTPYHRA